MVRIEDVFLSIRSRLGDTDIKEYRYSDEELLGSINDALADISERTLAFRKTWLIDTKGEIERYLLPNDFLRLIAFMLDDKVITDITSKESSDNGMTQKSLVSFDAQSFYLERTYKKDARVKIDYNYYERVEGKKDNLPISNGFKEPIVLYALHILFQSPNRENGLSFSRTYKELYKDSLINAIEVVRNTINSKNIHSKFLKV